MTNISIAKNAVLALFYADKGEQLRTMAEGIWRKGWDSNPRGSGTPCRFSRPVP